MPIASLILSLSSTEKCLGSSSLLDKIPLSLFFSKMNNPSSLTLYSCQLLQSLNHLHGLSLYSFTYLHVFLVLGRPGQDTALQVSWHHFPGPAGKALPNAAQDAVGLLCHKYPLQAHFQPAAREGLVLIVFGSGFQGYLVCYRMKDKTWNNSGGDNTSLETSV